MKTIYRHAIAMLIVGLLASCGPADFAGPNPLDSPQPLGPAVNPTPMRGHHGLCGPNFNERMAIEQLLR